MKLKKNNTPEISDDGADREWARRHHLDFVEATWAKQEKFIIGLHTQAICQVLDKVVADYKKGKSSFIIVEVPFRHGKTDLISRFFPPHYLGMFPNNEMLIATYGSTLAEDISRDARTILQSPKYQQLYPDVKLSEESSSVSSWGIEYAGQKKGKTFKGKTHWAGIGGGVTGKGYDCGIIDDFLKDRASAESKTVRDSGWSWFTDTFLTRRAPVSITIILATPWNTDDLIGRIKANRDPNFPKFEEIRFPAMSEKYKTGYLFPERFPEEWYKSQAAALGAYGTASLLQCEPIPKGGKMLKTENIRIIEEREVPAGLKWVRCWDVASTEKDLVKRNDPSWTAGVKMACQWEEKTDGMMMPKVYVWNVKRVREEAPARDRVIKQQAEIDGASVEIGLEAVAGYKDTFTNFKALFTGIFNVRAVEAATDKVVRADCLMAPIEAGNFFLVCGDWNQDYLEELTNFPSGSHDDQVDGTSGGMKMLETFRDFTALDEKVRNAPREDNVRGTPRERRQELDLKEFAIEGGRR